MNILIVCGGRDWDNYDGSFVEIEKTIIAHKLQRNNTIIMTGGARGADTIGLEWASQNEWNAMRVPAKWDSLGWSAGMARNLEMLELAVRMYKDGNTVVVLAFPGGVGTSGMVSYTKKYSRAYPFITLEDRR